MVQAGKKSENYRMKTAGKDVGNSKWDMKLDTVAVPKNNTPRISQGVQNRPSAAKKPRSKELELAEFKKKQQKPDPSLSERKKIPVKEFEEQPRKAVSYREPDTDEQEIEIEERTEVRGKVLKKTVIILAVILVVCIIAFLVYQIMRIDNVVIEGTEKLSAEYAEEMADIAPGTHIFVIDENEIKSSLERDPRIEFLSVEYSFPDEITVAVREHMPAACFYADGQYVVTDSNGKVLDISPEASSAATVKGLNPLSFVIGEPLKTDDEVRFAILKELLAAIEKYDLSQNIRSIDLENTYSLGYMYYTGMSVKVGHDTEIDKKVFLADKVNEKLAEMGKTTGMIDVSYGDQAIYTNPTVHQENTNSNALNYNLEDFGM